MQRKWRRHWRRLAKNILWPTIMASLLFFPYYHSACANPSGGTVTSGAADIVANGSTMTVKQDTSKAIINWQNFNIAKGETVRFIQPTTNSVTLNRVIGNSPSSIFGALLANGKVFLINPAGVLFAPGAQVNVGGLAASTLNIKDSDFLLGKYVFNQTGSAEAVVNKGNITALDHAVLIGPQVKNEGVITAKVTGLAAGNRVNLDFNGDNLINIAVDLGAAGGSAVNIGQLVSDGGLVVMSAGAKSALLGTTVNNSGLIRAQNVHKTGGVIRLEGESVKVAGTIDASAPAGGNGGFIETSGAKLTIDPHLSINAAAPYGTNGNWLIDPSDFSIGAKASGLNYLNNQELSNSLQSTNVTIQTDNTTEETAGDLSIDAPVIWTANTTLALSAAKDVNIKANINAAGDTAGLIITPNNNFAVGGHYTLGAGASVTLSGANANLNIAGHDYNLIRTVSDLQNIRGNDYYALGGNIDASSTVRGGFTPIRSFSRIFDGLGHAIDGLTIHCAYTNNVGLFKENSGTIRHLSLTDAAISGGTFVGAFAGRNFGVIDACNTASGTVSGLADIGGLTGSNAGSITKSYNTDQVTADNYGAGGLTGVNQGVINTSYNDGRIIGYTQVGGLTGSNHKQSIENCYNSGTVSGNNQVGGLAGLNYDNGKITHCYNTGAVAGTDPHRVNGNIGGLAGYIDGTSTIESCFWNNDKSATTIPAIGAATGIVSRVAVLNKNDMMKADSFSDWDIAATGGSRSIWRLYEGFSVPLLRCFLTPLTVSAGDAAKTYDGSAYTGVLNNTRYITPNNSCAYCPKTIKGLLSYGNNKDAGVYYTLSGLYSNDQQGFDISYATGGALTINKRVLTVTADNAVKYCGQPNPPLTYTVNGLASNDAENFVVGNIASSTSATRTSPAGRYDITATGNLLSSNYTLSFVDGVLTVRPTTSPLDNSTVPQTPQSIFTPFTLNQRDAVNQYLTGRTNDSRPLFAIIPPGINMTGCSSMNRFKQLYK